MFKKTLPPCRTRNARPIFNRKTHNAPNNALKHRNREGDHRRRNRIEDEKPKASLRDDGDEPAAPPPAPPPAPRPRGRPPKQRPDVGGRITAEPEPTLPTLLPTRHARRGSELVPLPKRSRHVTSFLDEEEEEQDESEEDEDEEGLPRGGITIQARTVATVVHHVVRRERQISTIAPMKLLAVASATVAYATHLLYPDQDLRARQEKPKSYNSEFRKRDTQRHRSWLDLSPWPSFPSIV